MSTASAVSSDALQADRAILWAGSTCEVPDSLSAALAAINFGRKSIRVLQGIASGLLGPQASEAD